MKILATAIIVFFLCSVTNAFGQFYTVEGTPGNDTIQVSRFYTGVNDPEHFTNRLVLISVNGQSGNIIETRDYNLIVISSQGGNDTILMNPQQITTPFLVLGGTGNDTITCQEGINVVWPGLGLDYIEAHTGDYVLKGLWDVVVPNGAIVIPVPIP